MLSFNTYLQCSTDYIHKMYRKYPELAVFEMLKRNAEVLEFGRNWMRGI